MVRLAKRMANNLGNSFFKRCRGLLSAAITTSYPSFIKAFITGMHLDAWPIPQSSGATNILFFNFKLRK